MTNLVHSQERADAVVRATESLFGQGNFKELDEAGVSVLRQELPVVGVSDDLYDMLVQSGLANSKSDARNFHMAGAITVNGEKAVPDQPIEFLNGPNLLKRGKNSFAIVDKN